MGAKEGAAAAAGGVMDEKTEKIGRFFAVCDELVEGSYANADSKISEALQIIATCRELANLFAAVTDGFDFPSAKQSYLREYTGKGGTTRIAAYLPAERQDVLAFVFCIFVEIDRGALLLGDFLLRYFYVDGSYTASYGVFAERMIKPFADIVKGCFPECGKHGRAIVLREKSDAALHEFMQSLPAERKRVMGRELMKEEKDAGELIFAELSAAAARHDLTEVRALLAAYRYFLRYICAEGRESERIFALAKDL